LNVSTDDTTVGANGHPRRPGTLLPPQPIERIAGAIRPPAGHGSTLAGLTAKQARQEPAAPGSWPRFLLKHACWILAVTLAAVAGAYLLLHSQTRMYKSQASVVVQPPGTVTGVNQAPDMATEKGIVSSGVVLRIAARTLQLPQSQLLKGLSATSPSNTFLLLISYSSPNRYIAQQRAQAIAEAYVAYRKPPAPEKKGATPKVITTPSATLITAASLPTSPSSPKPGLDYTVAVLLGLSLGIGTAAIRDRLNDRLRGPADLEERTGAPLLALIPAFWAAGRRPARKLVVVSYPKSVAADGYRGLRARIVQAAATLDARTLIVTSPAREDTDAVAANLAVALAQSGHSTVLLCADLRWGCAHRLLGLADTKGITGILDRRTFLAKALMPADVPGLEVLPAGTPPLDTGAMLQRPAFRTVLGVLTDRADFVIITAPPVLASADALILADLADMTLFVADTRRSARAQVRTAIRELAPVEGKIVGCVLTGVGRRRLLWRTAAPMPAGNGPAAGPSAAGGDSLPAGPAAAGGDGRPTATPSGHGYSADSDEPAHRDENDPRAATAHPVPGQAPTATADTPETTKEDGQ
jgi:polysaccharide biosynthesis transport protein